MEEVAALINEDRRTHEGLLRTQESIAAWDGPPLASTCSTLIFEGRLSAYRVPHPGAIP